MKLVDTHAHLQDEAFEADREAVIERALAELAWVVAVGDRIETSRQAVALCRDGVYASVGAHPYHAAEVDDTFLAELRELCGDSRVVALGEIGLDYHYDGGASREVQRQAFARQLELAAALRMPVIIHNRDAQEDMAAMIEEHHGALTGGVMHCFAGDIAFMERCVGWGLHVSFTGNVTYPKAQALREVAAATPIERLMIETDSPYLAPQPVRGKRCEPAFVRHTAVELARLKGMDFDTFATQTTRNAERFFGVNSGGRA